MIPKLRLDNALLPLNQGPDWNGYIGKDADYVIEKLKQWDDYPYIVTEDSLGCKDFRKITMANNETRVIIVCETQDKHLTPQAAKWIVLDVFVSTIRYDEPNKPFN